MRRRIDPDLSAGEAFASDPRVGALLEQLVAEPGLQPDAVASPGAFLEKRGFDLPPGLTVRFAPELKPTLGKPTDDWLPYSIRLTRCRTVWIRDPVTRKLREETVCFGIEITPNPGPGPIG